MCMKFSEMYCSFDIPFSSSSSRKIRRFNAAHRPQLWQPFLDLVNTLQAGFESMQTYSYLNQSRSIYVRLFVDLIK